MARTTKKRPVKKAPRRRPNGEEKDRVNMKIDAELKKWAVDYAERWQTSLTQIFVDHLIELRKREVLDMQRDAEQI